MLKIHAIISYRGISFQLPWDETATSVHAQGSTFQESGGGKIPKDYKTLSFFWAGVVFHSTHLSTSE